jgi:hypothetical protein
VDIGAYDEANIKEGSEIVWFPMPDEKLFWYGDAVQAA